MLDYEYFKKMRVDTVEKNGYTVKRWYQGMETYWAFKGEQEVFFGWCLDQLIDAIGFNPYEG